jgi:hypothetical protein
MKHALARTAALSAVAVTGVLQAAPAEARAAEPFAYTVTYDDFAVCGQEASLVGRVFLSSRSTGAESGNYSSTFLERTAGTLTVGDDTYRYHQVSQFSELEVPDGDSRTLRLKGWIRVVGSGPFAGTKLEQTIHTVVDANGVERVDTYVSSFCQ